MCLATDRKPLPAHARSEHRWPPYGGWRTTRISPCPSSVTDEGRGALPVRTDSSDRSAPASGLLKRCGPRSMRAHLLRRALGECRAQRPQLTPPGGKLRAGMDRLGGRDILTALNDPRPRPSWAAFRAVAPMNMPLSGSGILSLAAGRPQAQWSGRPVVGPRVFAGGEIVGRARRRANRLRSGRIPGSRRRPAAAGRGGFAGRQHNDPAGLLAGAVRWTP